MSFIFKILVFFMIFNKINMQMLSQYTCEPDDIEALTRWYSRVYQFVDKNQDIQPKLLELSQQLVEMKQKLQETQNQLKAEQLKCQNNINHNYPDEIVIQRRMDGSVDFYRTWAEYKQGFGNNTGEFFIGLDRLHDLTNTRPYALLIVMMDWENQRRYAKYERFIVGSELEKYPLQQVGAYSGSAGDSLSGHVGLKFTTKDQKNDVHTQNCAEQFQGAWWYGQCHSSNLNGLYLHGTIGGKQWAQGVVWQAFKDYTYSLKFVEMILIRT